jgi:hypothetical protein
LVYLSALLLPNSYITPLLGHPTSLSAALFRPC